MRYVYSDITDTFASALMLQMIDRHAPPLSNEHTDAQSQASISGIKQLGVEDEKTQNKMKTGPRGVKKMKGWLACLLARSKTCMLFDKPNK